MKHQYEYVFIGTRKFNLGQRVFIRADSLEHAWSKFKTMTRYHKTAEPTQKQAELWWYGTAY